MTEKKILSSLKALAKEECANYRNGFCLETDERCHLVNPRYPTIHDGTVDCDYFMDCVLPPSWDLNDAVSYALWAEESLFEDEDEGKMPVGMKQCEMCGNPFIYSNNRQRYCRTCSQYREQHAHAERSRRYRAKN